MAASDSENDSFSFVSRQLHWGPVTTICIVLWISACTVFCDLMFWPPSSPGGTAHLTLILTWAALVLFSHHRASTVGPGYVPLGWTPKSKQAASYLQYCKICRGYKAPRSHHCRKCNRCVLKMDHHCPWINTCCGHRNHSSFVCFLFFAPIGSVHSLYVMAMSMYYGLNRKWFLRYGSGAEPAVKLYLWQLICVALAAFLATAVAMSVGLLLVVQLRNIYRNETGIECWIKQQAEDHCLKEGKAEFIHPYDLGLVENFCQVFSCPGRKLCDGLTWPTAASSEQYALLVDELKRKQRQEKQKALTRCIAAEEYDGSFMPIGMGFAICCSAPLWHGSRLVLNTGDVVEVTQQQSWWP